MGVARQLEHKKLNRSASKEEAKPSRFNFTRKELKKLLERLGPYLPFRHTMRGFHYCKHRKCGNGWWIDVGKDNAYRKFAFVIGRNPLLDLNAGFSPVKRQHLAEKHSKAKTIEVLPVEFREKKTHRKETVDSAHPEMASFTEINERPVRSEIKQDAKPLQAPVDDFKPAEVKATKITAQETEVETRVTVRKTKTIEPVKHGDEQRIPVEKPMIKTEKIEAKDFKVEKTDAPAPQPKPVKIKANHVSTGKTKTIKRETAATEAKAPKTGTTQVRIPERKFSDVAIPVKPFSLLAASVKAAKPLPETTATFEQKIPENKKRKEKKIDNVYDVLKELKYQKIFIPKVAAAADSLN